MKNLETSSKKLKIFLGVRKCLQNLRFCNSENFVFACYAFSKISTACKIHRILHARKIVDFSTADKHNVFVAPKYFQMKNLETFRQLAKFIEFCMFENLRFSTVKIHRIFYMLEKSKLTKTSFLSRQN